MRGLFISVEGIDGCGKSTFVRGLAKALTERGRDIKVTAEPTDTWLGDAVRRSWGSGYGPLVEAHLFMADRVVHASSIRKDLAKGRIVISDRYIDSTLAYQGSELATEFDGGFPSALKWLRCASPPDLLLPEVTFFLHVDPETSMKRMAARPSKTKFEKVEYLRRVQKAYISLSGTRRHVTLDASEPPEALVRAAISSLKRRKLL